MADPLSITASAAGVISLGLTVSKGLIDYYESYKASDATVSTMFGQVEALASTLAILSNVLDRRSPQLDPVIVQNAEQSIENCRGGLMKLGKKLAKVQSSSQQEDGPALRRQLGQQIRRATFPFKESTLVKLREVAMELRSDLGLVLTILQIDASSTSLQSLGDLDKKLDEIAAGTISTSANVVQIGQDLEFIGDMLSSSQVNEQQRSVYEWLRPPDPFLNQDAARLKHTQSTNEWFLRGEGFSAWKRISKSILVIYGIPGSGKTIIASSIISEIEKTMLMSKAVLIYYYFDFNDRQKQSLLGCVSSLLLQLALVTNNFEILWLLYGTCGCGKRQPSLMEMTEALRNSTGAVPKMYIVLDALDECSELDALLDFITALYSSSHIDLKILATSRKERNIDDAFDLLSPIKVDILGTSITQDIQVYVQYRLNAHVRLRKWCSDEQLKTEVQQVLVQKADGMFRWVVCQLDALQKCLTVTSLKKTLLALPVTLNDTYDRILLSIDHSYHQQTFQIFQWLVVARRPLYLEEAAEAVAILPTTMNDMPFFDANDRLSDPSDIFQICLSLVSTTTTADATVKDGQLVPTETLSLAHFSVKEYLTSEAIRQGPCPKFYVDETEAHMMISQASIAYLLDNDRPEDKVRMPLAKYAARFWNAHAELAWQSKDCSILVDNVIDLLGSPVAMFTVHRLCKPHYPPESYIKKPALHWATQYGLSIVVERLLCSIDDINIRDAFGRTALHIAIQFRQENIARSLIRNSINIDAQDLIGTALHYAVHTEDISIVQTLLDGKADPNARKRTRNTPLYSAAQRNNLEIVAALLNHGADPNMSCSLANPDAPPIEDRSEGTPPGNVANAKYSGTALQVAAWRGFSGIVRALLDAGASLDDPELILLSQGKIEQALEAMDATGNYPYHFLNQLPDYTTTVEALQRHTESGR